MTGVRSMLAWDVRLQYRYGFYTVYAVLTVAYVLALRRVPSAFATDALVFVVVSDPSVLGFYFIAALVLYEKREGVLDSIAVSPLGVRGYLVSKVVSLTALAVVASLAIALLTRGRRVNVALLVVGVALTSTFFVLVGFVAVARFDSINEYFFGAVGYGVVLVLPLAGFFGVYRTPLYYLLPMQPALLLVEGAFVPIATWELVYGVGYLLVGCAAAYAVARRAFRKRVVEGRRNVRRPHATGRATATGRRRSASQFDSSCRFSSSRRSGSSRSHGSRRFGPVAALAIADLRNWVRDPMLLVASAGPLALALVARFGLPYFDAVAGPGTRLAQYYPVVAAMIVVFTPFIFGFVVGFFLLEDRDAGVITALRVTPLSGRGYLAYRGVTAYIVGAVPAVPAVLAFGLVPVPPLLLVSTVAVAALSGPLVSFLFAAVAADTIEGIALNKLVGLAFVVPLAAIAAVPEPAQFAAGVLPPYWPAKALVVGLDGGRFWPYLAVGTGYAALLLAGFAWLFDRRAV